MLAFKISLTTSIFTDGEFLGQETGVESSAVANEPGPATNVKVVPGVS